MLEWLLVITLIIIGLSLIIVELIFIPGTTLVGILGLLVTGSGVYLVFKDFGAQAGFITLSITGLLSLFFLIISFRSKMWKRFALKNQMEQKVNEDLAESLQIGEEGTAVSALRPIGKAEFNDRLYEVKTDGYFLKAGQKIKITKIEINTIYVEPTNQINT
ncbi:NfeD family protein [Xanthovirga aplysinae]|uniref:NfeD family protein n=1 Tax=Xanthovirga aplysinae TaxID=2529853 RepID=UPI0012BC87AA|nr:NfeD family protein [Xanthovirga aplysinae]MTI32675.1 hypothetical protein [Xanthovirga aplysinae]